jgi:hypothetical protein
VATTINSLVPELQPYCSELLRIAGENRLEPRITSARRSIQEQRNLYARFLRGANPFPVAPPGTSAHETGEAFDMVVTPVEYLPALGELWQSWGGQWGGNRDPVHFQLPGAPSPELLAETKGAEAAASDPFLIAQSTVEELPWWVGKLLPWQLKLYKDYPIIRGLINPSASFEVIQQFFENLRS